MRSLLQLRKEAESSQHRAVLLILPNRVIRNARFLDPHMGLLIFDEMPDSAVYMNDLPEGTTGIFTD